MSFSVDNFLFLLACTALAVCVIWYLRSESKRAKTGNPVVDGDEEYLSQADKEKVVEILNNKGEGESVDEDMEYEGEYLCMNCGETDTLTIPKGQKVHEFITDRKCAFCKCNSLMAKTYTYDGE